MYVVCCCWQLNAPIHGEMEQLQAQLTCLKSDQGQQLQDMHAEMLSLDEQLLVISSVMCSGSVCAVMAALV